MCEPSTSTSKPHRNCEIWHHGLGPPCCLSAYRQIAVIDGKMDSNIYQDILQENLWWSVSQLKDSWIPQQRTASKSSTEWCQRRKIILLAWPIQSTDLKLIEMLCFDLNTVIHTRHPKNTAALTVETIGNIWLRILLPKEGQPKYY